MNERIKAALNCNLEADSFFVCLASPIEQVNLAGAYADDLVYNREYIKGLEAGDTSSLIPDVDLVTSVVVSDLLPEYCGSLMLDRSVEHAGIFIANEYIWVNRVMGDNLLVKFELPEGLTNMNELVNKVGLENLFKNHMLIPVSEENRTPTENQLIDAIVANNQNVLNIKKVGVGKFLLNRLYE